MAYTVQWDSYAERAFGKLPREAKRAVSAKVALLVDSPRPAGVSKLRGHTDTYRLRVGEYRVLYRVIGTVLVVLVVEVGPRKSVYKDQ